MNDNYKLYLYFLQERESIRLKKENNEKFPWTKDEILRDWKFTNISRKHDAFTILLKLKVEEWRKTKKIEDIVFNIIIHRMHSKCNILNKYNWFENSDSVIKAFIESNETNDKFMTGAFYRALTKEKIFEGFRYFDEHKKEFYDFINNSSLSKEIFKELESFPSIGKFMAWQILCDLKLFGFINETLDEKTFVIFGIGSIKGMKLMPENLQNLIILLNEIKKDIRSLNWIELEEIEHSLCEFFKYHRGINGGKIRTKYKVK